MTCDIRLIRLCCTMWYCSNSFYVKWPTLSVSSVRAFFRGAPLQILIWHCNTDINFETDDKDLRCGLPCCCWSLAADVVSAKFLRSLGTAFGKELCSLLPLHLTCTSAFAQLPWHFAQFLPRDGHATKLLASMVHGLGSRASVLANEKRCAWLIQATTSRSTRLLFCISTASLRPPTNPTSSWQPQSLHSTRRLHHTACR